MLTGFMKFGPELVSGVLEHSARPQIKQIWPWQWPVAALAMLKNFSVQFAVATPKVFVKIKNRRVILVPTMC